LSPDTKLNRRGHVTGDREQLLRLLRGLRALAEPGQRAVGVDVDVRRLLARAVVADGLDDPAVARRTGVGDDDAIGGLLLLAHAHEADLDGHELTFLSASPPARQPGAHARNTPEITPSGDQPAEGGREGD